jgi:DNA-binding Lrp family transcriptional regulator
LGDLFATGKLIRIFDEILKLEGLEMKAYVLINIRAGDIASVIQHLKRVEGVSEATMTFGPYDGVAVVEAEDLKAIGRIIYKHIQPIPGVIDTLTCLAVASEED